MLDNNDFRLRYFPEEYDMSQGHRMAGFTPLSEDEISLIKKSIRRINADETKFVFNHEKHLNRTCYNPTKDVVYVGRNVFPDVNCNSAHPRDLMSIACVLAHEYYGHRKFRQEYLHDFEEYCVTTSEAEDECRASITAAKECPNLSHEERSHLIQEAHKRAEEFGIVLENDDFMKEVLYGYSDAEAYYSKVFRLSDNTCRECDRTEDEQSANYSIMPPL